MDRIEKSLKLFEQGSACSQAILATFAASVGMDKNVAHKLGAGLGGGIGRKQYVCGAVNAGAILISLKYGNENPKDKQIKDNSSSRVRDFIDSMEKELSYVNCSDLLGVDISTEDGLKEAERKKVFDEVCSACVRSVAEYLDEELNP